MRANAIAIYLGDPDCNLIEVRTYARRSLVRIAIGDARQLVRDAIDATQSPDSAVVGNEAWTRKELLAHLTRSKAGFANRLRLPPTRVREIFESVHDFNARPVAERRDWTMQALAQEIAPGSGGTAGLRS